MSNELQSLNERIAERIGSDLVDLIPKDQWQQMVNNEIANFKRIQFPKIIEGMLNEICRNEISVILNRLTKGNKWDKELQADTCEELEKFIAKSSGVIVAGMLSPIMQTLIQDIRNRLGTY